MNQHYLNYANSRENQPEFSTSRSRKTLTNLVLILDMDETLGHTFNSSESFRQWANLRVFTDPKKIDLRDRCYVLDVDNDGVSETMWGIKRPHLNEFLKFCFGYFKVIVLWSAGIYEYVHAVKNEIFKYTNEPHAVLTRINCVGN